VGNGIILHVDRSIQGQPAPDFKLSNCNYLFIPFFLQFIFILTLFILTIGQGRKRALLIGINYTGTSSALRGCINDVKNLKQFLVSLYNFNEVKYSREIERKEYV
jgi:hypothetical protein